MRVTTSPVPLDCHAGSVDEHHGCNHRDTSANQSDHGPAALIEQRYAIDGSEAGQYRRSPIRQQQPGPTGHPSRDLRTARAQSDAIAPTDSTAARGYGPTDESAPSATFTEHDHQH